MVYAASSLGAGLEKDYPKYFELLGPQIFQKVAATVTSRRAENFSESLCEGRLTLTSGTAVTTSDVTAATTVYFTPYQGNQIFLYSGTAWQMVTFSEVSVAVPATMTTPFDIFGYNNSGSLALETANWTDDSTRATALTLQNGIYVKTGAATRRYLGTARTTGVSGETEDSLSSRLLWNYCNRVKRSIEVKEATGSWTYTTNTWRSANNSNSNRIQWVVGLAGSLVNLKLHGSGRADTLDDMAISIGSDSTSARNANVLGMYGSYGNDNDMYMMASLDTYPTAGFHYYQWLEISTKGGGGTVTFYGTTHGISGIGGTVDG